LITALPAVFVGLLVLVSSAEHFMTGASKVAAYFGMAPLLIGMVIVGLGTSFPEMTVSALAAAEGAPSVALGNAYGSNIANIAALLASYIGYTTYLMTTAIG